MQNECGNNLINDKGIFICVNASTTWIYIYIDTQICVLTTHVLLKIDIIRFLILAAKTI